jgi:Na+/citrate or Na+/malate symporter
VIPLEKIYSSDTSTYEQKTVSQRLEALFLANVGLVVTRCQQQFELRLKPTV